jgi:hypothetical protein
VIALDPIAEEGGKIKYSSEREKSPDYNSSADGRRPKVRLRITDGKAVESRETISKVQIRKPHRKNKISLGI